MLNLVVSTVATILILKGKSSSGESLPVFRVTSRLVRVCTNRTSTPITAIGIRRFTQTSTWSRKYSATWNLTLITNREETCPRTWKAAVVVYSDTLSWYSPGFAPGTFRVQTSNDTGPPARRVPFRQMTPYDISQVFANNRWATNTGTTTNATKPWTYQLLRPVRVLQLPASISLPVTRYVTSVH